ncbi:hypothetical protein NE857_21495 [Nocardiopsis exhalans]|uniref:Uncharacterized protein n=1 Tax=Nocardiopsis exhalans TaxID=163604 RepID=A0ABY5D3W6_9ACTN|nr:hypothetical protein [Nocardiopsis exhalans]USY17892.1 hypothetical protein NE857_21495 [Nocardiopsis exhalans]
MSTFTTPRDLMFSLIAHRMRASLENRWMDTPIQDLPWCGRCHIDIDPITSQCECWDNTTNAPLTHWPSQAKGANTPPYTQPTQDR